MQLNRFGGEYDFDHSMRKIAQSRGVCVNSGLKFSPMISVQSSLRRRQMEPCQSLSHRISRKLPFRLKILRRFALILLARPEEKSAVSDLSIGASLQIPIPCVIAIFAMGCRWEHS